MLKVNLARRLSQSAVLLGPEDFARASDAYLTRVLLEIMREWRRRAGISDEDLSNMQRAIERELCARAFAKAAQQAKDLSIADEMRKLGVEYTPPPSASPAAGSERRTWWEP